METGKIIWTDGSLIGALKQPGRSAEDAIKQLYREHYGILEQYVVQNQGSRSDAEDIFQETMVAFIRQVEEGKFRGESSIRTFLYALNRNIWLNELKKRDRSHLREEKFAAGEEKLQQAIDGILEQQEHNMELMRSIQNLGDSCKKILLLFYYEQRPIREILSVLPYQNEQVVRNKKMKCLKKLEEMVKANGHMFQKWKNSIHG
jgi:RNA polymerase sigma factor (sigma-70 family)